MKKFIVTEYNLFLMRKNEDFSLIDVILKRAIKRAKESQNQFLTTSDDCINLEVDQPFRNEDDCPSCGKTITKTNKGIKCDSCGFEEY